MVRRRAVVNAILVLLLSGAADAKEVQPTVRLEITSRSIAFGGATFADHGTYEQIAAIAHMRIDPKAKANRGIVDLDRAPRDAHGLVNYDIDVFILRPRDPTKARRVLMYDVVNRGNKVITRMTGDGFLMRQGYTVLWSGWQGDITAPAMIGARIPVATDHGRPLTGRTATETIFHDLKTSRITLPYPAATLNQASARLTVRQRADDPEQAIGPGEWRYEDRGHVWLRRPANMDAGAIYRFSYVAQDPRVMGLGFAATRDLVAFLRHADAAGGNPLADIAAAPCERNAKGDCGNPDGGAFDTAVAFGSSQSGRYLRDLLWQGFNRDLARRRVFDGMVAMIPGGRRTFTNMRFSEPGRFSRQHEDHDVPGFDFPFAYGTLRDPVTGRTDGILRDCSTDGTCPKLFHIDTSAEFWQAGASLVGTGGTDRDVAFPANVRAYMIAGGSHTPGFASPICRGQANPLNYTPATRALLIGMVEWASGRSDPPESRWPSLAKGELRSVEMLHAPDLTSIGQPWPKVVNRPVAPAGTRGWPVLVPTVDADGNDIPGIQLPQRAAPTGTYLGWNLRKPGYGEGELCLLYGSFIPFAKDAASRGADPRLSIAERYPAPEAADALAKQAVVALRKDRLMLEEDAASIVSHSR